MIKLKYFHQILQNKINLSLEINLVSALAFICITIFEFTYNKKFKQNKTKNKTLI